MYYLLSGRFPFTGKTNKEIMVRIKDKATKVEFPAEDWEIISDEAKDLLK
jgi:hypothetical protein